MNQNRILPEINFVNLNSKLTEMSKIITDIKDLDLNGSYTYADYLLWQFTERLELIKGKIFEMTPAPSRNHQQVSLKLTREFDAFFINYLCELYVAPFDVRLVNY